MKQNISPRDFEFLSKVFKVLAACARSTGRADGFLKIQTVLTSSSFGHFYSTAISEINRLLAISKDAQRAPLLFRKRIRYHEGMEESLHIGKRILEEVRG